MTLLHDQILNGNPQVQTPNPCDAILNAILNANRQVGGWGALLSGLLGEESDLDEDALPSDMDDDDDQVYPLPFSV